MADDTPVLPDLSQLQGKRYLITGGTGFLGWHLIPVVRILACIFYVADLSFSPPYLTNKSIAKYLMDK